MGEMNTENVLTIIAALCLISAVSAEVQQVNSTQCINSWESWSSFSESGCDDSCSGIGSLVRTRDCPDEIPSQPDCLYRETEVETIDCSSISSCETDVDGQFTTWSSWRASSRCSAFCGSGMRAMTRTRTCTSPPPSGDGSACIGNSAETADQSCSAFRTQCRFICSRYSNRILTYPRRTGQYLQCTYGNVNWRKCMAISTYQSELQRLNTQFSWFNFNYNIWVQRNNLMTLIRVCAV